MGNPMKYIKDLEAAGFERIQAEAQVQMVLDALEGDLATKADFQNFQEKVENRFTQSELKFDHKLKETEFRLISRLGFLTISTVSIAVAILAWLIKI